MSGMLCAIALAGAAWAADPCAPAEAIGGMFRRADPVSAAPGVARELAAGGVDANGLVDLLRSEAAYPPLRPGWREQTLEVGEGPLGYDVRYGVLVPSGYDPRRPWPIVLAAHGQHGSGRSIAGTVRRLLGSRADEYVLVAPTMPGPAHYSGKAYQEQAYLAPLAAVRRRVHADDARIYVTGYSQGGHVTWHLGALFGRHFAGGLAMAGVPWFEGAPFTSYLYLENMRDLPFWSIWGQKDHPPRPALGQVDFNREAAQRLRKLGAERFRGTELPGVGHAGCYPKRDRMAEFFAAHRREPICERFVHTFHHARHARGQYLEALELYGEPMDMDKPIRLKVRPRAGDRRGDHAMEAHFRKFLYRMEATLNRRANTLTIRLSRIRRVRVYVQAGMFDLSRPVTIRANRGWWRGRLAASMRCMLTHYAAERDGGRIVLNEVDVPASGPGAVRFGR